MIVAATLTENDRGDSSQVKPLLAMVEEEIASVTADGAYDGAPTYEAVAAIADDIEAIIPPRVSAVLNSAAENIHSQRERHMVSNSHPCNNVPKHQKSPHRLSYREGESEDASFADFARCADLPTMFIDYNVVRDSQA